MNPSYSIDYFDTCSYFAHFGMININSFPNLLFLSIIAIILLYKREITGEESFDGPNIMNFPILGEPMDLLPDIYSMS